MSENQLKRLKIADLSKIENFGIFYIGLCGTSDSAIGTKWLLKRLENALDTFWGSYDQN
jgi:hypothetical protein